MVISDLPVTPARGVRPTATVARALDVSVRSGATTVPVLDANGELVGVVTRDAARRCLAGHGVLPGVGGDGRESAVLVRDLMTPDPPLLSEHDGISVARTLFDQVNWDLLPVTSSGGRRLVGVLHRSDVAALRHVGATADATADPVRS